MSNKEPRIFVVSDLHLGEDYREGLAADLETSWAELVKGAKHRLVNNDDNYDSQLLELEWQLSLADLTKKEDQKFRSMTRFLPWMPVKTATGKSRGRLWKALSPAADAKLQLVRKDLTGEVLFSLAGRGFPSRVANEEIGDTLERIHRAREAGRGSLHIGGMIALSLFWITLNSLSHLARNLYKRVFSTK